MVWALASPCFINGKFWDANRTTAKTGVVPSRFVVPAGRLFLGNPLCGERLRGSHFVAVDAGNLANHRGTFVYGIADQKKWFDQLIAK